MRLKTTDTTPPPTGRRPASPCSTETRACTGDGRRPRRQGGKSSEGGVLNVFSHGVLVIWAILVVMPLLWAVMTSFKTDDAILSSTRGRCRTSCTSRTGRAPGPRRT